MATANETALAAAISTVAANTRTRMAAMDVTVDAATPTHVRHMTPARSADTDHHGANPPAWAKGILTSASVTGQTTWRSETWVSSANDDFTGDGLGRYYAVFKRGDVLDVSFHWQGTATVGNGDQQSVIAQFHGPLGARTGPWLGPAVALTAHSSGTFRLGGGVVAPTGAALNGDGSVPSSNQSTYFGPDVPTLIPGGGYPSYVDGTWYHHRVRVLLDGPGAGWVSWWIDGVPVVKQGRPKAGTWYVVDGMPERSHFYQAVKFGCYGYTKAAATTAPVTSIHRNMSVACLSAATGRCTVWQAGASTSWDDVLASAPATGTATLQVVNGAFTWTTN